MKRLLSVLFIFIITICAGGISASADEVSLQELIDAASPGDIITITPGDTLKSETVRVNKAGLKIIGNGAELVQPIDEERLNTLSIDSDNVTIENLKVTNNSNGISYALLVVSNNCRLDRVIVTSRFIAVGISGNAVLTDCVISGGKSPILSDGVAYFRDCEIIYSGNDSNSVFIRSYGRADSLFSGCEFKLSDTDAQYGISNTTEYSSLAFIDCVFPPTVTEDDFTNDTNSTTSYYDVTNLPAGLPVMTATEAYNAEAAMIAGFTSAADELVAQYSLQAAINALKAAVPPVTNPTITIPVGAILKPEQVVVDIPGLTIDGNGAVLEYSVSINTAGGNFANTYVLKIAADNVTVKNLTVRNNFIFTNGSNQQAPAVNVTAEECKFEDVTLESNSEITVNVSGSAVFLRCDIIGLDHIVYGGGQAYFKESTITAEYSAYLTGFNYIRVTGNANFLFSECEFNSDGISYDGNNLCEYYSHTAKFTAINCTFPIVINYIEPIVSGGTVYTPFDPETSTNIKYYGNSFPIGKSLPEGLPDMSQNEARSAEANMITFMSDAAAGLSPAVAAPYTPPPVLPTFDVTFIANGGFETPPQSVETGDTAAPPTDPEREGYAFVGWFTDDETFENEFDFSTPITEDITLYAYWVKVFNAVMVTFNANGGTDISPQTVESGNTAAPPAEPVRNGYAFVGWFTDNETFENEFDFLAPITVDITLYAYWVKILPEPKPQPGPSYTPPEPPRLPIVSVYTPPATITLNISASLNPSGSINAEKTAAAVAKAARQNNAGIITVNIPENGTGISTATIEKLVKTAGRKKLVLSFNGIKVTLTSKTEQILFGIDFETERIYDPDTVLASFETAQKNGFYAEAEFSLPLKALGITAEEGETFKILIHDIKTGKNYNEIATVKDGKLEFKTKQSGVFAVIKAEQ